MAIHEKARFHFLSEFGKRIHAEGNYGPERKRTLSQLKEWQYQNRTAMNTATDAEVEQRHVLDEVFKIAIKFTERSFIPPWERN